MKLRGKMLGVSPKCFYTVVLACTIGILLGSFFDFQINERLASVTKLGSLTLVMGKVTKYLRYKRRPKNCWMPSMSTYYVKSMVSVS